MAHWDELVEQDSTVKSVADYCGCILPNQVDIIAFPNNRRFILHPIEHAGSYHIVEQAAKAGQCTKEKTIRSCSSNLFKEGFKYNHSNLFINYVYTQSMYFNIR